MYDAKINSNKIKKVDIMKNFLTRVLEDLKERHQAGMKGWNENVAKPRDDMFFDDADSGFRGHNDTGETVK